MNKAFQVQSFGKYFLDSLDQYSLHSPFLYDFYTTVVRDNATVPAFLSIEEQRKSLKKNQNSITVLDHGSGISSTRRVSEIAKRVLTPANYSRFLYRLCTFQKSRTTLELGGSLGINTMYLALSSKQVVSMEGDPASSKIAKDGFRKSSIDNITHVNDNIDTSLKSVLDDIDYLDIAYIDANHTYESTLEYFDLLIKKSHKETVLVFDDIHWSKSMNAAWNKIRENSQVTLSIDLFQHGIVYFKPEFRKQHFTLWLRPW